MGKHDRAGSRSFTDEIKFRNDIVDVAFELGCLERRSLASDDHRIQCPTGHSSVSGTCCSVSRAAQLFHCFSCHVGGDVITFVQYVRFGEKSPQTFRAALELLATRAGLKMPGTSDEAWRKQEEEFAEFHKAKVVLGKAADIFHAALPMDKRRFLQDRYGFTDAVIAKFKLGYSVPGLLTCELRKAGVSDEDMLLSGLFRLGPAGPEERFTGRLMFPYQQHHEVVYFIGRKTENTPQKPWEEGKYKKLKTYGPNATYIAKRLENKVLFNQQATLGAKSVVITEGIADCISLDQHGIAAISPVTVRFSRHDQEIVLKVLRKGQTIFIANDNDANHAGEQGALAMARHLARNGFTVKLIEIPLLEKHQHARRQLAALEGRA